MTDADRLDLPALLATLRRTPDDVAALARKVAEPALRTRRSPDEFSALENVWHLRDIEALGFLMRIRRLLSEEKPYLADVDGARLAVEGRYNERDLEAGIESFRAARYASLAAVEAAGPGRLGVGGEMEGVGPITLRELLGRMVDHDRGHVGELEGLIGKR
ncbi:MAG TPA: DinB family protein [Thermoanaerobaculia bacterium]|jgi:hypothetical protein|nr:DinB family protein [Thermoanaerobaculia bacterium]